MDSMYSIKEWFTWVRIFNIHESSKFTISQEKICMLSNLFLLSSYLNRLRWFALFHELHSTADVLNFLNDIVIQIFITKNDLSRNFGQSYFWSELRFYNILFYHVSFYKQVIFYLHLLQINLGCRKKIKKIRKGRGNITVVCQRFCSCKKL